MDELSISHLPIIVMGVAGCGKSSVATAIAGMLARPFIEGDALHPQQNIAKMTLGQPLDDEDRRGWLDKVGSELRDGGKVAAIVSCSALKKKYRDQLRKIAGRPVVFLYLDVPRDEVQKRMSMRRDHFMPPTLIDSQYAALEVPVDERDVLTINANGTISELAERFLHQLRTSGLANPPGDARIAATH